MPFYLEPQPERGPRIDYHELRRAALAAMLLEQRREERDRALGQQTDMSDSDRRERAEKIRYATSDAYRWLTQYTKTFNPHWKQEGKSGPHEPFPDWPFIPVVLEYLDDESEKVKAIEKSRDLMLSWTIAGYFTLQCMLIAEYQVVVQSQTDEKGVQIIDYAKQLYQSQPSFLREAFPTPKPIEKQAQSEFLVGSSSMFAIAGGADKLRSYHPTALFSDETAFQPYAGESYNESIAAVQKIVLNSTANPGWYFDWLADADLSAL